MNNFYEYFVNESLPIHIARPFVKEFLKDYQNNLQFSNSTINDVFEQQGLYRKSGPKYRIVVPSKIDRATVLSSIDTNFDPYIEKRNEIYNYLRERTTDFKYLADEATVTNTRGQTFTTRVGKVLYGVIGDVEKFKEIADKLINAYNSKAENLEIYKSKFLKFCLTYPTTAEAEIYATVYPKFAEKMLKLLETNQKEFRNLVDQTIHKLKTKVDLARKMLGYYEKDPLKSIKIKDTGKPLYIIFSRHPYDIAGASTGRTWTSCKKLGPDGWAGAETELLSRYKQGLLVSYLISSDDLDIKHPYARVFIEPYEKDNQISYQPSYSCYGINNYAVIDEYMSELKNWINTNINSKLAKGKYKIKDTSTYEAEKEITI